MKKLLMIICAVAIFIAGCSNEQPVAVKTEKVISADSNLTLTHDGAISTSNEIKIFSPISGKVLEKYFEDGSDVTEGQQLFKVGSQEDSLELSQKKAELAESMTALARGLVEKDPNISELQFDIEKTRELIQKMEDESARGMIYAPKSGRLGANVIQIGMPVTANETLLATIGNADPAAVTFEISEAEKQILSASDSLKVSLKLGNGTTYPHEGAIKIFGNTAEATFINLNERLILGEPAQVEIGGAKNSNELLVPESAIIKNDVENFVYIDDNKKAAVKKILLGDKVGTYFIVKDGLKADDYIIVEGFKNLREGTPLDATNAK